MDPLLSMNQTSHFGQESHSIREFVQASCHFTFGPMTHCWELNTLVSGKFHYNLKQQVAVVLNLKKMVFLHTKSENPKDPYTPLL